MLPGGLSQRSRGSLAGTYGDYPETSLLTVLRIALKRELSLGEWDAMVKAARASIESELPDDKVELYESVFPCLIVDQADALAKLHATPHSSNTITLHHFRLSSTK